jgi:lysophospholipase L1-like esterase
MLKRTVTGVSAFGAVLLLFMSAVTAAHAFLPRAVTAEASAAAPIWLRVMPLGDSITDGGSVSSRAGYRLPLWNLAAAESGYGLDFVGTSSSGSVADADHEGHSGWMIDDIRKRIAGWASAAGPDVVLLHIGINDLDRGDPTGAPDRLAMLVDEIYAVRPSAVIILAGLIPSTGELGDRVKAFNARARMLPGVAQSTGHRLRYVDMPLLPTEMVDKLHPNDAGYRHMATVYAAAIADTVADGDVRPRPDSLVEEYAYPDRAEILTSRKVKLNSGDGGILLVECGATADGSGLLEVTTVRNAEPLCFGIRAAGVLDLVVPDLHTLRISGRPGDQGPPVIARSWTGDGVRSDVTIPPDGVTVTIPRNATLARLTVDG